MSAASATRTTRVKESRLSRAIAFFEEAPYREARVAFILVKEVMDGRAKHASATAKTPAPVQSKQKAPKPPAAAADVKKPLDPAADFPQESVAKSA